MASGRAGGVQVQGGTAAQPWWKAGLGSEGRRQSPHAPAQPDLRGERQAAPGGASHPTAEALRKTFAKLEMHREQRRTVRCAALLLQRSERRSKGSTAVLVCLGSLASHPSCILKPSSFTFHLQLQLVHA